MRLDRVLAHKKLPRDFAVAHPFRDQFKDLKLAPRDAQVLSFLVVRREGFRSPDRDFLHNGPLPPSSQLAAKPDTKNRKRRRDQSAINLYRMLDDQKAIFRQF